MKTCLCLIILFLAIACLDSSKRKNTGFERIAPISEVKESNCVFDTISYLPASEIINKVFPGRQFVWEKENKEAIVPLENGDTLALKIGGCSHYAYQASYYTDKGKFGDSIYLFQKVKWLAQNFFDGEFQKGYLSAFEQKKYFQWEGAEPDHQAYGVTVEDKPENFVFEGFSFFVENERTIIWIGGYIN